LNDFLYQCWIVRLVSWIGFKTSVPIPRALPLLARWASSTALATVSFPSATLAVHVAARAPMALCMHGVPPAGSTGVMATLGDAKAWPAPLSLGIGLVSLSVLGPSTGITAVAGLAISFLVLRTLCLRQVGGRELAAHKRRIPLMLDGFVCTAAAAVLARLAQGGLAHAMTGHVSAEAGHRRLVDCLGQRPLLDLGMRLGEASGACLAVNILRGAIARHSGMATFTEAGIAEG